MSTYDEVDLTFFDIRAYLDDRGINWSTEGKNISNGWIGLNCPFCNDHSNHMGINLQSLTVSCWKCGKRGNVLTLVMNIDQCSFNRAKLIIPKFTLTEFSHLIKPIRTPADHTIFPGGTSEILLPIHRNYLKKRGYDPDEIQRKYDILGVGPTLDNWKFRIIIPVYLHGELVTYLGKDTTGLQEIPYKNAPVEKSIVQCKHTLYGIDQVRDTAIIVEGVFDAWRIGQGAVPCFGTQYTIDQLLLLKNVKRVFVLFDGKKEDDGEAIKFAHRMANDLTAIVPEVEVLELDEGDPDTMTADEVWELRREINI